MSKPVAVVTGAASGIGLSMTKHLLSRGYRVAMADVNSQEGERISSELGPDTMFQQTDVASYEQQAALVSRAFEWGGMRLDFFAANAGIDDRQSLYQDIETIAIDENGIPKPLNLKTIDIDLNAVLQGIWLFKYYAGKNTETKGGKVVVTSSSAGIYSMPINPQYTAAKHALVGLTRAAGPILLKDSSITLNCICPAFVRTNLCPPHMLEQFPKEHLTPMSTVIKALDTFLDDDAMTGQTVELSLDQLYFRKSPEWANASQRWMGEDSAAFWEEAYKNAPPVKNGA